MYGHIHLINVRNGTARVASFIPSAGKHAYCLHKLSFVVSLRDIQCREPSYGRPDTKKGKPARGISSDMTFNIPRRIVSRNSSLVSPSHRKNIQIMRYKNVHDYNQQGTLAATGGE